MITQGLSLGGGWAKMTSRLGAKMKKRLTFNSSCIFTAQIPPGNLAFCVSEKERWWLHAHLGINEAEPWPNLLLLVGSGSSKYVLFLRYYSAVLTQVRIIQFSWGKWSHEGMKTSQAGQRPLRNALDFLTPFPCLHQCPSKFGNIYGALSSSCTYFLKHTVIFLNKEFFESHQSSLSIFPKCYVFGR